MKSVTQVLFVCTGNICRSPLAEAILRNEFHRRGVDGAFTVESAGTDAYHVGESTDSRMRDVAAGHGVAVRSRSRRVRKSDLDTFDYVFAMDTGHLRALQRFADDESDRKKIILFRDFDPVTGDSDFPDVPDPWYGDRDGFETVYRIVERTCGRIADMLVNGDHD